MNVISLTQHSKNTTSRKKVPSSKKTSAYNKTGGMCGYCGKDISEGGFTVDHIHPVSNGGTNDISNLLPCCLSCNASKGKRDIEDYRLYAAAKVVTGEVFFGLPQLKFLRDVGALDVMGVDTDFKFYFELAQGE